MNEADLQSLAKGATVLDVGCFGFGHMKRAASMNRLDLRHFGVDYCQPPEIPEGFTFRLADVNKDAIPFRDDQFDLVIASTIIEHLTRPVEFFGECLRVCKPGGRLFLSTASERSLWMSGFPFAWDKFHCSSFYDDPTHVGRPWSPQSLWRLARYYGCTPVECDYDVSWGCRLLSPVALPLALILRKGWLFEHILWKTVGWISYIVVEKPRSISGSPAFYYYIPSNRADDWLGRGIKRIMRKPANPSPNGTKNSPLDSGDGPKIPAERSVFPAHD